MLEVRGGGGPWTATAASSTGTIRSRVVLALVAAIAVCLPAAGPARQQVTVEAPSSRSTVADVRLWRREGRCWQEVAGPWAARVGRDGLSAHHREGDGTTPPGPFRFGPAPYGVAPD